MTIQETLDHIENTFHNREERDTKILSATLEAFIQNISEDDLV